MNGDEEAVHMLLDTGVSPTSKFDGTECPPLGWAAINKHMRYFQDPSRRDSQFANMWFERFLDLLPVTRVSLFFLAGRVLSHSAGPFLLYQSVS